MNDPARTALPDLAAAIRTRRAILFAGAGLSMTLGLPSWAALIERMTDELGLEREGVTDAGIGHPTLAEYYRMRCGGLDRLRRWMGRRWQVDVERVRGSRIHQLIVGLNFPIIYTTNYDHNLEVAHEVFGRDYVKIVNARDVAAAGPERTEIVKFHGDLDDPSSLVVTETDYFDRLAFSSPLDIKFRADAMGRTLLFIGYSMSDTNIRLLLHRLWQSWRVSGLDADRPPSFMFMPRPHPVQEAVLAQWGVSVLTEDGADSEAALTRFLESLHAQVAADHDDQRPQRA